MKKILLLLPAIVGLVCVSLAPVPSPPPAESGINWMSWKEVQEAQKKSPRKIYVDTYTSWCGWCKRMDATTFSHPEIIRMLNENFYSVKFDAEMREPILFKGKTYNYVTNGSRGYNEFAAEILSGKLSYPTSVYFDETLEQIFPIPGYLDPKTFEGVLHFVSTDSYKTSTWEKFQADFKGKIQ